MSERAFPDAILEPERYELEAPPPYHFALTRRDLFKALGGGIVVLFLLREAPAQQERGGGRRGFGQAMPREIGAWLHLAEDGSVTVYTGKAEVGQDIRTSLTQVVAEELRVPLASIRLVMADTDLTPFDMGTFGSRTTPVMAAHLRRTAAAARELLLDLAAEQAKAHRGSLVVADGKVTNPGTGQSFPFGELTRGRKLMATVDENVATTPAEAWRVAGKAVPKVNGRAIVTGAHRYSSDIKRPGMLYGKVLRPAAFGATLVWVDAAGARRLPGVTVVHDGEFVGVAAPDEWTAARALAAIRAEWKTTPQPSGRELFAYLKRHAEERPETEGRGGEARGVVAEGLATADQTLTQSYTVAYIAHAPLEPRAAVAEWENGRLTVWTGTQRPFGVRGELARAFRLSESDVRVIVPDTGSGYGGKHTGEAAIEAARLARAAGRPVKLVWTREEEFTWAYFRPAGVIEITSGARRDGTLTAWECHNYNSGAAGLRTPYVVPNQRSEFHSTRSPLRQGSYRALAATANHFARETHMDELAHALNLDPLAFRRKNLGDPRLLAVLEAAASAFGWDRRDDEKTPGERPSGRGVGIAAGFEKGSYVATCAEVSVDRGQGRVRVGRVVTAFECGAILNPDHLRNQVEGCIIQGLGGALFEEIEFEEGKIVNPRFSRYRVPRFSDVPALETVLLDRKDLPSAGAGETPIVALAPAVGNAIFAATGVRLRSLPMAPHGVEWAGGRR